MVVLLVIVLMEAHRLLVLWPYQMNLAMIHFGGLMLKDYFDRHLNHFHIRKYQSCCFGHDHRLRLSHFAVHWDLRFGFQQDHHFLIHHLQSPVEEFLRAFKI